MKRARLYLAVFTLVLAALWILPDAIRAQDVNRVALVVRHSDASVQSVCVEFQEDELSSLELIQRSGLELEMDVQGLGALVCRIDQTGCSVDDCWCQCKGGGDCVYWSYWHQIGGKWEYSLAGASQYTVRDGDVEGWSWGPGNISEAIAPPATSFENVCMSSAVEIDTPTPTQTSPPVLFVPDETATPAVDQGSVSNTETPIPTATTAATATTAPTLAWTATSSSAPMPVATEQPATVAAQPEMQTGVVASEAEAVMPVEREPDPTATVEPSPSPALPTLAPLPASEVVTERPTPETVAEVAMVDAPLTVRPGEKEARKLSVVTADVQPGLAVVGAAAEAPDLRVKQLPSESLQITMENESRYEPRFTYVVFALIVSGLLGLLFLTSARQRGRQNSFNE